MATGQSRCDGDNRTRQPGLRNYFLGRRITTASRLCAPPRLAQAIEKLGAVEWVARAGNGVAYYRGGTPPPKGQVPVELTRRIKDAYDPKHLLPELTW